MTRFRICATALVCASAGAAFADIIHVPGDYPTIQEAIDAAQAGDEVVVAPGTYYESLYLDKSLTLRSSDGADVTVLDGQESYRMLTCEHVSAPGAVVTGFCFYQGLGGWAGGALYANLGSTVRVNQCKFLGNVADFGGALFVRGESDITVTNSVFSGNYAFEHGGATYSDLYCSLLFQQCIFVANNVDGIGNILFCSESPTSITNSILWGTGPNALWGDIDFDVAFCNSNELLDGPGNISADPLFVDPLGPDGISGTEDDDLRLQPGSPCIDAGCNYGVPYDEWDFDDDGDTDEFLPFDLDGNARFMDDLATTDTGCGNPPVVDMGAYEFVGEIGPQPCVGDLDGDGAVTQADLGVLLAAYGQTDAGDLNCDGVTDQADLGELLAAYGQSCD